MLTKSLALIARLTLAILELIATMAEPVIQIFSPRARARDVTVNTDSRLRRMAVNTTNATRSGWTEFGPPGQKCPAQFPAAPATGISLITFNNLSFYNISLRTFNSIFM